MADISQADLEDVTATVHPVMAALAARVPLTLLMDLADPAGPDSRTVLSSEVAELGWLRDLAYPAAGAEAPRTGALSGRAAG